MVTASAPCDSQHVDAVFREAEHGLSLLERTATDTAEIALLVTSWLSSYSTTWLRAASRGCEEVFVRNVPGATVQWIYLEALDVPDLAKCEESPQLNPYSPLRCFRLNIDDTLSLRRSKRYWDFADSLSEDRDYVLAALAIRPSNFLIARGTLTSDRDIVLAAVNGYAQAIVVADERFRSDREIVLAAVRSDGFAIKYASEGLRRDREIILAAASQDPTLLQYVAHPLGLVTYFRALTYDNLVLIGMGGIVLGILMLMVKRFLWPEMPSEVEFLYNCFVGGWWVCLLWRALDDGPYHHFRPSS